jgi:putative transposase
VQKAFRFRAYPNGEQAEAMTSLLETHRRLYNIALAERKCVYKAEQRTVTYKEQSAKLKTERKSNLYPALCNFSSCQRTLKRLDRAFAAFFRRVKSGDKPGFPRFRGFGRFDSVDFTIGDGAKLTDTGRVYFQNVGEIKRKLHRPLEGVIKTATFQRHAGHWYVIFVCDIGEVTAQPSDNPAQANASIRCVGIDLGLKSFLVTSEAEAVDAPKLYRKAEAKLRRVQRAVARKKRGGKNRRKAVTALARVHAHVANQRKDFYHKTALSLVRRYGLIAHEDLNVRGMVRPLNLAKSTQDAGWSQFLAILSHKAECAGVEVVAVDPRHTTQACSRCGSLPPVPIGLSCRTYSCCHCGFTLDRDHNAAINILKRAGTPPLGANVAGCGKRSLRSPRR